MSLRLTLVAHAPTAALRAAAFPLDEPLDADGQARARALAASMRGVDAAWTAPALRTRQTAEALGLSARLEPALRDIGLGHWAGRPLSGLDPEAVARWTADPAAAPHGGESVLALLERVRAWLATLAVPTGRHVAVTHPAVMRGALVVALAADPAAFWRIDVGPLCRLVLHGQDGRWTLRSLGPIPRQR